jgi:hypothetical protein
VTFKRGVMPIFETNDPEVTMRDPRYVGAIDLVRRNGAREIQLRYDDEQKPIVWIAVAGFSIIKGKPSGRGKINAHQVGGGFDPLTAIFALCHACLDRHGFCMHCGQATMFDETFEVQPIDFYCWYQWDPELQTFRRGCEGST